jgi:hypothetical protein
MKKLIVCGALLAMCCTPCLLTTALAQDKGPTDIVLQSTIDPAKPPKPSVFPHGAHQSRLECKTCHHSKSAEGKRISYAEGQKIEKCETCHNTKVTGMPEKINTFKKAAHAMCQDCHKKNKTELAKCSVCHKK